ncbi:venom acid phosphatase Acph-1 [Fopius arisanus]|uniref:acid phosphatase n=1 Tax=Fopius arisanus TaxID=64838 RepID=A0A0C9RD45_9HYME|nr:PREDICTED: venom acid phosphatase Acph-1-like [Fopius arisanus]
MNTCDFNVILILMIVGDQCNAELKFIQSVFRHGARSADSLPNWYPNDPYSSKDWYPVPNGGLTNIGKKGSFDLGKFFRTRYGTFLGDSRHPDVVKFFSSHVDRTKTSGQLVAAGLYPPQFHEKWNSDLDWQPIPIQSAPSMEEAWFYFSSVGVCSNYMKQQKLAETTNPIMIKYLEDNKEFFQNISRHAGTNGTYELAYIVYVTINSEIEMGLTAPQWTEGLMAKGKLKDNAEHVFNLRGINDDLKKISAGVWLKMWLENIEQFVSGRTPRRKALFWSGHDQNVGDLLVAMGSFDEPHVPPYNSAVILELHHVNAKYFVKALYKRHSYIEPLYISGCNGFLCPLEKFKEKFAAIIPEDPRKMCGELL